MPAAVPLKDSTVLLPELFKVVVADDGPAHAKVTTALGVPVNTSGVVAPDVIDAVPVTLAVGNVLTVTTGAPAVDCEQPDKVTVAV